MDGVIADTVENFLRYYEKETGIRMPGNSFNNKPEYQALPDNAVKRYVVTPGFFRSVPVMAGAREALLQLSKHHEIYIVSAAMEFPQSLPEKYEWLAEHFEFIQWRNIVFCGDKSIINTDYMIDDHLKNLDHFSGKALIFTAEHNRNVDRHERLNNWQEALRFFENAEKERA